MDEIKIWILYDRKTGKEIGRYKSRVRATRRRDKLDNLYGAYRYAVYNSEDTPSFKF